MSSHNQPSSSRQSTRRGSSAQRQQQPSSSQDQLIEPAELQPNTPEQQDGFEQHRQLSMDVIVTRKLRNKRTEHGRWINQYLVSQTLGKGQHGEVYLAIDYRANLQVVRLRSIRAPSDVYLTTLRYAPGYQGHQAQEQQDRSHAPATPTTTP